MIILLAKIIRVVHFLIKSNSFVRCTITLLLFNLHLYLKLFFNLFNVASTY